MKDRRNEAAIFMDTVVNITVVTSQPEPAVTERIDRAFQAFRYVEQLCSRFDPQSEVRRLSEQAGRPMVVSPLLFEAVRFACQMAEATGGAFDPTVGARLESYGFTRHYLTREAHPTGLAPDAAVSYRDILLDEAARTIRLTKPLLIDLGAIAKGLAVDLAAKELAQCGSFLIDAGGDLYLSGLNERDQPWQVGIQHPLRPDQSICSLRLTDAAICTSGSYERPSPVQPGIDHLLLPGTGDSRTDLLSCTVVAPFAMLADAMSTAAYVMGRQRGSDFLEANGLGGAFVEPSLAIHYTDEMMRYVL